MGLILLILLILLLVGAFPRAGAYNADWGQGPMGLIGLVIVVVLVLMLLGHLPHARFDW